MPTLERRITAIDTIPASAALSGTVTTSAADTTVLFYTGPVELDVIYKPQIAAKSLYVWVDGGTPQLARVAGVSMISLTGSTYVYNIQLVTAIAGASADTIRTVNANLLGYSYKNDGGTIISANGITMPNGTSISEPQLAPSGNRNRFQDPVLIDANSGSVLVLEDS